MISPLGQRQVLTTAAMEAIRVAHQGAVHEQQVQARREALITRLEEGQFEVPDVEETEGLHLDPERQQGGGGYEPGARREGPEPEGEEAEGAGTAEGHLDFLA